MFGAILLSSLVLGAAPPNPHLVKATKLLEVDLDFAAADRELDLAVAMPGNSRPTVVAILEKQAMLAVYTQDPERAFSYYKRLLVLAPDFKVPAGLGPKAAVPFGQAQQWVKKNGSLKFVDLPPQGREDMVEQLQVKIASDPLSMAGKVRFHVRSSGRGWNVAEVTVSAGVASTSVQSSRVEWWAELLGSKEATFAVVGSAQKPLVATPPAPVATVSPDVGWDVGTTDAPASGSTYRTVGYTALGLAAASLAGGVVFSLGASSERGKLAGAERNGDGVVTGITQREAFALDRSASSQATIAGVLFGATAALAVTGGVLVWSGGSTSVAIAPAPGGLVFAGEFP